MNSHEKVHSQKYRPQFERRIFCELKPPLASFLVILYEYQRHQTKQAITG